MMIQLEQVVEELGRVAFGQADDSNGSAMKYASKLKALELLGKHLGLFDHPAGGKPVVIVDDIGPSGSSGQPDPSGQPVQLVLSDLSGLSVPPNQPGQAIPLNRSDQPDPSGQPDPPDPSGPEAGS